MTFIDKGPAKSSLQIQEDGVPSKAAADAFHAKWKTRFKALAEHLADMATPVE